MTTDLWKWASDDRGSYSLETAVLVPVIFAVLGLLIAFGRVTTTSGAVDSAAREAARAASLDRDPGTAQRDAQQAAQDSLSGDGVPCTNISVSVDTSDFDLPLGQTGTVVATVTCTARLSDIGLPGLPGTKTLTSDFRSPIDAYRART
ncbi:TadE/TadG family type IV pilus assembly protein [Streptantibioticus parmotrematis]|uniref:TadE/TadG family type IV pilus assembly protein n=1 Tax=Streptantibioticus parmotrematis TaxID=2873249 RepID=UPI0033E706C8